MPDTLEDLNNVGAQRALEIAFQTMQERCQQLENRLAAVEEENIRLRIEKSQEDCKNVSCNRESNEQPTIKSLQDKIEELMKQKSQLSHHVLMVAAENRQLWNRLTRLTRTNKNLGSKLIKISDTLKKSPNVQCSDSTNEGNQDTNIQNIQKNIDNDIALEADKDASLEEISLRLINSIMMEKSELEQQCSQMAELQNGVDVNLKNIGFAYPDDTNTDSLEQLKQHEARLCQTKNALMSQQGKLKKVLLNLKKINKASKKVCQTGTQFDSDDSLREHGSTQTSLPLSTSIPPDKSDEIMANKIPDDSRICPICGELFEKSVSFDTFHEHVCSHFGKDSTGDFEILS